MNLYVGTSGYSYAKWKGRFYPAKIPAGEMLRFYARAFRAVEINSTFYRPPEKTVLKGWVSEVPAEFRFVLKAFNGITHIRRLKEVGELTESFLELATSLGDRLGPILFQLPPNFKKDVGRLEKFLGSLSPEFRCTFEFRHESWFEPEVFELLRAHKVALCIAESDEGVMPQLVATADWGYLRLRKAGHSTKNLKDWAGFIQGQTWRDAFVFFMHEDTGTGPRFAKQLLGFF